MNILMTGGTGLVGAALCRRWSAAGHRITVLSRRADCVEALCGEGVVGVAAFSDISQDQHFDAVINLAGEPIADRRWTAVRKQQLRQSRIDLTASLLQFLRTLPAPPSVLISGSAVGYYGDQGDHVLDEEADAVNDFAHQLCRDWERAALQAEALGTRVCVLRIGLVIANNGGFLSRMAMPFRLGLGGALGSGEQWMSWIHRDDLLAMIDFLLDQGVLRGVFNATAPCPVTNLEFSRTLARTVGRSTFLNVPAFALKIALGEMSSLLLGGQRVVPKRLQLAGFNFRYRHLQDALKQACAAG